MNKALFVGALCLLATACSQTSTDRSLVARAFDYPTGVTPQCGAQSAARVPGIIETIAGHIQGGAPAAAAGLNAASELIAAYEDDTLVESDAYRHYVNILAAMSPWMIKFYNLTEGQISEGDLETLFYSAAIEALQTASKRAQLAAKVAAVPCP